MARKSSPVSVLGGFFIILTWLNIYEGVSSSSCQSLPCLYFGNGNTLKAIEINSSKVHTVLTSLNSVKAVDVHIKLNLVYWSETRPNAIKRLNVSSGKEEDILTDNNLGEIDGLAVEWESGLIYWTDYTNERIEVAQLDGKNRQTLIAGGIHRPREIAVDPRKGYMFWISRSFRPRIERATLSGDSKTTLVSFGFSWWPNGITLDFYANRLYWVDSGTRRIESVDFNGNNRQRFKTLPISSQPYDIVLYSGVFYYSDTSSQSIAKIDKATKQYLGSYTGLGASNGLRLAMFSPVRQPKGSTACHNNGGCSHFCLLSPAGNQCACPPGEILKSDGKTCDDQGSSARLLLADRTRQELYQIPLLSDSSVSTTATALPLNNVRRPQGVDFDPVMKYVYWSDDSRDEIFRAFLNGSAQEQVVDQLGSPDGIAVDSVGRNLYWTDRTSNRIEVAKLDGSFRKTLVYENLYDPVDIILDMENGYMYWSEGASGFNNPKIERADMDGTNRKVIITLSFSFFRTPNGLALDKEHNRLYYVVGRSNEISFVSLSTNTRSTFLTRSSFGYPKGVALHGKYIYWTEGRGQSGAVYRADRVSGGNVQTIVDNLSGPEDICVYDANYTTQTVNSSCGMNNGGCSHLCLLTPRGHQCACPNEMKLKTDKKNCYFSEFLLYADSSKQKIFLINLDNSQAQPTSVKLGNTPRPEALDYDPQERFIYWSDLQLRQILRAYPDGSAKESIINNGLQGPKGLAVDHVGRNLYWTDFDANRIEVSKLNGSYRKVLVSQNIQKPMDIVLDLKNGYE